MSFLLGTGTTRWVLEGEWCVFDHAPSTRQLRAVAVQRQADHFVFKAGTFHQAGFFSLKESFRDTDVNALAWTVAQEKGPLFYGEYLYEKTGDFWVIATDRNGSLGGKAAILLTSSGSFDVRKGTVLPSGASVASITSDAITIRDGSGSHVLPMESAP